MRKEPGPGAALSWLPGAGVGVGSRGRQQPRAGAGSTRVSSLNTVGVASAVLSAEGSRVGAESCTSVQSLGETLFRWPLTEQLLCGPGLEPPGAASSVSRSLGAGAALLRRRG